MPNMNFFCAACNIYISSHSVRFSFHVHSNEKVIRFTQQHLPRLKVKFTCNICLVRTSRDPSFLDILHIVHWKCFYIRFELVMRYFQFRQRMKFTFPCTCRFNFIALRSVWSDRHKQHRYPPKPGLKFYWCEKCIHSSMPTQLTTGLVQGATDNSVSRLD